MNIGFLFDLDGVLIDSETEYTRIWDAIDTAFPTGVTGFTQAIKGTTLENILSTYFQPGQHEAVCRMLRDMESAMTYNYCTGAEELLKKLQEHGIHSAIVTSSKADKMKHLRQQRPELWELVNTIVDADCVTRSKPDPQGYLIAATRLGLSPAKCVVVEDSLQGIRAGKAAGCHVVGLTATFGKERLEGEADVLLDNLNQLDFESVIQLLRGR